MIWDTVQSPFASVIGTNYVPSTAELEKVKDLLPQPQIELSKVLSEIDRVQAALDDLLSQKQSIENYIDAHKSLLSPVRRIPPETLAEIFIHCLPTDSLYAVRNLAEAPLIFTTICRDWRQIALNTPRLWRSLHFFLPSRLSDDVFSRRMAGITLWLERSGSLPLSISFHDGYENDPLIISQSRPAMTVSLIRSLMHFSDRMQDVYLSLSSSSFPIFDNLSPSFPILTSLHVRDKRLRKHDLNGTGSVGFGPLLHRMPALEKLELNGFNTRIGNNYRSLPCNWKLLTELVIQPLPLDLPQVIAILSETPRMQSVSVGISLNTSPANLHIVHLSNLHKMRLAFIPIRTGAVQDGNLEACITCLLKCIQCPALLALSLRDHGPGTAVSQRPFLELFLHNLETLELEIGVTPEALSVLFSISPNLITFILKDVRGFVAHDAPELLRDSHLSSLTYSPSNLSPSWPHLQSMQIYLIRHPSVLIPSDPPITSATLTAFLKSRSQASLKSCIILFRHKVLFSEAELKTLRSLKERGLKLDMQWMKQAEGPSEPDLPDTGLEWHQPDGISQFQRLPVIYENLIE
ncbi:hypothetical protein GGU10DRAFT_436633 [Lentinula aff. detonsa]|uniref:F-box domain-containing protein n=1 Tax=Lentinula aff. detonsa TaxID=2804958 RepID=A0AA38KCT1_9AGAR|nr:hypothetical protein GGU10DRAFT_436633 [Lentinula aff. detonsa]